jgi:hypothetical protein
VQVIPIATIPVKPTIQSAEKSEEVNPVSIRRILEDDIKPLKGEYSQLKELDARMHVLKFSTDISKKFSGYIQGNVATITLNRCFKH